MRRFLSLLLAVLMVLSSVMIGTVSITAETTGNDTSNTGSTTRLIPEGATEVTQDNVTSMDGSDGIFYLSEDIKLENYISNFRGTLYGNGKSINLDGAPTTFKELTGATVYDLTITGSAKGKEIGALVGTATDSHIEHVTNEASVTADPRAAGIVFKATGNTKIVNCVNKGEISNGRTTAASKRSAAGIVAISEDSSVEITGCRNEGEISSASVASGIYGVVNRSNNLVIRDCVNIGTITGAAYAAGILGAVNSAKGITIENCTNKGAVSAEGIAGGIASSLEGTDISEFVNCLNEGNVFGKGYVGGILGTTLYSARFEYCSNNGEISGSDDSILYAGGIAGAISLEGYFYRCDNSGDVYGNAMTGGIAGASGLSAYAGPFGGQRFIGCTHTGLVSVTQVKDISNDATFVPGGIVGYARSDIPYRSIIINYCAVTGDIELNRVEGCEKGNTVGVLAATVDSLTYAKFEYNYFTGTIKVNNGAGVTVFLPYDGNTSLTDANMVGNYSMERSGLYYYFDAMGPTKFSEESILRVIKDGGSIDYEKILRVLNGNFETEVFVMSPTLEIPVFDKEEEVSKDIPSTSTAIKNAEEFLAMDPYGNYYLTADITLDKTYEYVFGGILNGNGYTITTTVPIFESVEDAHINHLTIDGSIEAKGKNIGALVNFADGIELEYVTNKADILNTIGVTSAYDFTKPTGGLVGKAVGTVTLTACRNEGSITAALAGGLVGSAANTTFNATDCVNAGTLMNFSTKASGSGGILAHGQMCNVTLKGCYNTGNLRFITAKSHVQFNGGMIGCLYSEGNILLVTGCANSGNVSGWQAGGLVGFAFGMTSTKFEDCKNAGRVVSTGQYAGGIAAWVNNTTTLEDWDEGTCNAGITHYFTNCTNIGDVYSGGKFAAGILALTFDYSEFENCLNTGNIETSSTNYAAHAAGIVAFSGGQTNVYYCVNTGDITGSTNAAGIGGFFGHRKDVGKHLIIGCVNTGNILSIGGAAVGIVRRTPKSGPSGLSINGCVVDGTIKSMNGDAFVFFQYSKTSSGQNISGNAILLEPEDISGTTTYLAGSTATGIDLSAENAERVNSIYIRNDLLLDKFSSDIDMPADYRFTFADEELTDGTLLAKLNAYKLDDYLAANSFVMNDGIPMHKDVVDVYGLKYLKAEDFIPEEALPEEKPEDEIPEDETTAPEDSTSEPESSDTVEPDTSDTVEPGTTEPVDTTTKPGSDDTTKDPADETTKGSDAGSEKPDDDKKKGCGSVVSATLALAALALIAPAMVIIKKKDEE